MTDQRPKTASAATLGPFPPLRRLRPLRNSVNDEQREKTIEEIRADTLTSIYSDEGGFMSRKNLYKAAVKRNPDITMQFVNAWYDTIVGKLRNSGPKNSFVAPHANWEYQIDLFQLPHLGGQGMACIDVFSKFATVVPAPYKRTKITWVPCRVACTTWVANLNSL